MVYLFNGRSLKAEPQTFDFGTIHQVSLGEKGRGRKLMALTCPEGTEIQRGDNPDLTIGFTKSGKPKIVKGRDGLYMMISTAGGYTRRGDGFISVLKTMADSVEVLAKGNGADGDAGRIGSWDVALIKVTGDTVIKVRTSGAGYGTPSDMIVVKDGKVTTFTRDVADEYFDSIDADIPWTTSDDGCLNPFEWHNI